jgi:hypothetical protein
LDLAAFRRGFEIKAPSIGQGRIPLGRCQDHRGQGFWVGLPIQDLATSRAWITGASGTGKSIWLLSLILSYLQEPGTGTLIVGDFKGELADILVNIWLPLLACKKKDSARDRFLERIWIISPFSRYLPELNVTLRNRDIPIELQAYDVANTVSNSLDNSNWGIRMEGLLKHIVKLACELELPLPQIRKLLTGGPSLAELVRRSEDQELREYFAFRFPNEAPATIHAIASRLDNLFLLPETRQVLSGRTMLDFSRLLEEKAIVIINLGNPQLGLEALSRFWGSLLLVKLSRAIMSRPIQTSTKPACIILDEFQVALNATQAESFERLLTQSRYKKVGFFLACQQVAQIAKVSPSLVSIMANNTTLQVCFRTDEARHLEQALPVTGLRPRREPGIPIPGEGTRCMSSSEERKALLEDIARLPHRHFYLSLKGRHQAQLLRTGSVDLAGARRQLEQVPSAVVERIQRGVNGRTREELAAIITSRREQATRRPREQDTVRFRIITERRPEINTQRPSETEPEAPQDESTPPSPVHNIAAIGEETPQTEGEDPPENVPPRSRRPPRNRPRKTRLPNLG